MEKWVYELSVIVILVLVFLVPFSLAAFWRFRQRRKEYREAMELKRGNKIYSEWRKSSRQELE